MRLKPFILCSTSAAVMAVAAPAMAAQTSLPSTPPVAGQAQTAQPAAPAAAQDNQNSPAGGTPAAAQDAAASNGQAASDQDALNGPATGDIVVTGLRRSLESAQNIKRNSDQQIDSIVASDIGKLPDVAVSDVAARIPGVQVDRGGGEAGRVLIRGLPDFATTYNGREIFTAETRSVALQDFPAGGIAALEVFKTTTSDLVEGGLAGEVNVRSRKPFDFDGFQIAGSAWGQYEKRSTKVDPNGNLLVTDRWDTGIGEIGALVNASYTQLSYVDSSRSNTDFIATPGVGAGGAVIRLPDIQRTDYGVGKRSRPSLNGALQWRPHQGLEFYAEALWQGFRNQVADRELEVPLYGGASYNNIVLQPGTNLVQSATVVNPNRPDGFQGATYGKTDTFQYAVGGKWDANRFHLSVDVARTASRYLDSVYSFDTAYASPQTVTINTGLAGDQFGPTFSFGNGNALTGSPTNYIFRGFFDRQLVAQGHDWQGRADASYDTGLSFLPKIEAGFRYVDRESHFEDGSRYAYLEGSRFPLSAVPVAYDTFQSGFPRGPGSLVNIYGYYTPTYDGIRNNVAALRQFVGFSAGAPAPDPLATYTANEKSYAGYAQVKYVLGSDTGIHLDGNVGVRVVGTKLTSAGTSLGTAGYAPVNVSTDYTDVLPNASARLHFTDKLQLRLSATKTRSRPAFAQYDPAVNAGSPPGCEFNTVTGAVIPAALNPNAGSCIRNASSGNPSLQPLKSKNYDASLEWYFTRTGTASVAVFRRDLNGFISNYNVDTRDENGYTLRVNQPFNTGSGRIQGFEAQFTTFLDIGGLPTFLRSFGIDSNVTYLDAKTGVPAALGGAITQSEIQGVSKWTYNVGGIYEHGGASLRLSWNHRSDYLATLQIRDPDVYSERVRGIGRLDFSGSYDLVKNLTVTFDWTNILAKPFRSDLTYTYGAGSPYAGTTATLPRIIRYEESVISTGIRFRF